MILQCDQWYGVTTRIGWWLVMMVVASSECFLETTMILFVQGFNVNFKNKHCFTLLFVFQWVMKFNVVALSPVFMMHCCRYWQTNMNNVKANKTAHKEAVRDLRYTWIQTWRRMIQNQLGFECTSFHMLGNLVAVSIWLQMKESSTSSTSSNMTLVLNLWFEFIQITARINPFLLGAHDSFSSTDLKFCSCSDDTTVKVWDFARCQEERSFTGKNENLRPTLDHFVFLVYCKRLTANFPNPVSFTGWLHALPKGQLGLI